MLSVANKPSMLSVGMLNVVMPSVVAPIEPMNIDECESTKKSFCLSTKHIDTLVKLLG